MSKRLVPLALALVLAIGAALPVSAAVRRIYIPYDTVELYTTDIYSPYTGSVNLSDAVANKTSYATAKFYADAACTEEVDYRATLTQDTPFWVRAEAGSWRSDPRAIMVYVSGTGLSIEADYNEADGTITLTAAVERGNRRRIPTGEVTFTRDGAALGTVKLSTGGKAICTFPAESGEHTYEADYLGDENFGYASASTRARVSSDGLMASDLATEAARSTFTSCYKNRIAVAPLSRTGAYGVTTHHLITLDLTGFNTEDNFDGDDNETLRFYLYDDEANTFQAISGYLDEYDRVNVVTARGGHLIVSEGPLEKR